MSKNPPTEKSLMFRNPKLAKQWHPKKNGVLTPEEVSAFSGKKVWWQCKKGHEWEAVIANRSNGRGCAFCSGRRGSSDNNLAVLNPELAKQWHPTKNHPLKPEDITVSSGRKVWWQCGKKHEWEAALTHRSRGTGCPYCLGKKVGRDNNLAILNPELAKQWHPTKNHPLTPEEITVWSHKKVWWQCKKKARMEVNSS